MFTQEPWNVMAVGKNGKVKLRNDEGCTLDNVWSADTIPQVGDTILIEGHWLDNPRNHTKCVTFEVKSWKHVDSGLYTY
jgi:hypothetical protein